MGFPPEQEVATGLLSHEMRSIEAPIKQRIVGTLAFTLLRQSHQTQGLNYTLNGKPQQSIQKHNSIYGLQILFLLASQYNTL